MTKKHSKKTLELGKHTIFGREGGRGSARSTKKKLWVLVYFPRSATSLIATDVAIKRDQAQLNLRRWGVSSRCLQGNMLCLVWKYRYLGKWNVYAGDWCNPVTVFRVHLWRFQNGIGTGIAYSRCADGTTTVRLVRTLSTRRYLALQQVFCASSSKYKCGTK